MTSERYLLNQLGKFVETVGIRSDRQSFVFPIQAVVRLYGEELKIGGETVEDALRNTLDLVLDVVADHSE